MLQSSVAMEGEPIESGYLDRDEVGPALVGHRLGEQRFAAAGRTEEQDTGWHGQANGRKLLWVPYGLRDGEGQLLPDLQLFGSCSAPHSNQLGLSQCCITSDPWLGAI